MLCLASPSKAWDGRDSFSLAGMDPTHLAMAGKISLDGESR